MTSKEGRFLLEHARNIRRAVVEMTTRAGSGHIGGSLSSADIITYLFFRGLRFKKNSPKWEERDRFILSAGHICPALYAALAETGIINKIDLNSLRQLDSNLQGHPDRMMMPVLETSSGSLGQGLSVALGMALALKYHSTASKIVCLMSDGEQEEGSTWEAAMAAAHYRTDNLIGIVDRNGLQLDGSTENVIGLAPLGKKYRSFGWEVIEADGHDYYAIDSAYQKALRTSAPAIILAYTIMGKGIKSIENNFIWHGKTLPEKDLGRGLEEIDEWYNLELKKYD